MIQDLGLHSLPHMISSTWCYKGTEKEKKRKQQERKGMVSPLSIKYLK